MEITGKQNLVSGNFADQKIKTDTTWLAAATSFVIVGQQRLSGMLNNRASPEGESLSDRI